MDFVKPSYKSSKKLNPLNPKMQEKNYLFEYSVNYFSKKKEFCYDFLR